MRFCRPATRIRRCSSSALILYAGFFLMPSQSVMGQNAGGNQPASLSDEQLDELVGPIALYPDKLIAIVLPASTYPLEVVQAYRLLENNNNKMSDDAIKQLDFDTSILALMHYPEVLGKMNKDLDWTTNLGDAVANQQEEVMAAIQRFRSRAMDAGNLVNDDKVIYQEQATNITIVSASPTVIYVPTYDPYVVVVRRTYPAPVVSFAAGVAVGAWLSYGCNWHHHHIDVDIHGHRGYWGGHHHYGHIHGGVWGTSAGRRAAARTGARAGARAGYRTGRRQGTRQGYRAGRRAGQRNNAPRTGRANRARGTSANRSAKRSANRTTGKTKPTSQARSTTRRSGRGAYGGYKSGRSARSNSSRGARSRGGGGRSRGGGGRRR
ncbi:MAG: DUF3300 domain-containing protein [Planctomycetes bacterium]|nr:DUF3300 domain-containing protein [Planctomycetota bacterium]